MLSPSPKVEFSYNSVPEKYQKWAYLEGLIYDGRPNNIEEAKKILKENNEFSQQSVYYLIINAASIRPFSFQIYAELFLSIPTKSMSFPSNCFTNYLVKRSILPAQCLFGRKFPDKSIEDYENVYTKETLEYIVSKDDLGSFLSFISSSDNSITLKTLLNSPVSYDTNDNMIDCISLAAFCGAKSIFMYLLESNHKRITQMTIEYAIRGGKWEIIHQIVKLKYDLSLYLKTAISYNHNSLVRYILSKYKCQNVDLCFCAASFNTLATFYFLANGASVDIKDYNGQSPLMCAVGTGNLELVKLLIDYGANIDEPDQYGLTPLNEALSHSFTDIAQYLMKNGTKVSLPLQVMNSLYNSNTNSNNENLPSAINVQMCDDIVKNFEYQLKEMDKQINDLEVRNKESIDELENKLSEKREELNRLTREKNRIDQTQTGNYEVLFKKKAEYENYSQELINTTAKTQLMEEQISLLSKDIEQTKDLMDLLPNDTQELYDVVVKMIRLKYSTLEKEQKQKKDQIQSQYNYTFQELNTIKDVIEEIQNENRKFNTEINDLKNKIPPLIMQKKGYVSILERNKNGQPKEQLDQMLASIRAQGKQGMKDEKKRFAKELKQIIFEGGLKIQKKSENQIKVNALQAQFEEANEQIEDIYNKYNNERKKHRRLFSQRRLSKLGKFGF